MFLEYIFVLKIILLVISIIQDLETKNVKQFSLTFHQASNRAENEKL